MAMLYRRLYYEFPAAALYKDTRTPQDGAVAIN
jgi:hypothetical protein